MEKVRIVIIGGGESGVGAALLGQAKGFEVFVSDFGTIANDQKAELVLADIPFEENKHSEEKILNANEVVKSPGISDDAPLIIKLKKRGIPIISESSVSLE